MDSTPHTMLVQHSELEISALLICIEFVVASFLISMYWWRRDGRDRGRQRQVEQPATRGYHSQEPPDRSSIRRGDSRRIRREDVRIPSMDTSTTSTHPQAEEQVEEADTQPTVEIRWHQPFDGRLR